MLSGLRRGMVSLLLWAAAATGCTSASDGELCIMRDTDPFGWHQPVSIDFECTDSLSQYTLSLAFRFGSGVSLRNLPLTITTAAPDSVYCVESFDFPLRSGAVPASTAAVGSVPYRDRVHLSEGRYTLTIEPAVTLRGVEAAGIILKKRD